MEARFESIKGELGGLVTRMGSPEARLDAAGEGACGAGGEERVGRSRHAWPALRRGMGVWRGGPTS